MPAIRLGNHGVPGGSPKVAAVAIRRGSVFVSYAHESERHAAVVKELVQQLVEEHLDVRCDSLVQGTPPDGWLMWMERQVRDVDFVIVVGSQAYVDRFEGRVEVGEGRGVAWEALLTRE